MADGLTCSQLAIDCMVQTSSISLDLTWHIGPAYSLASTHMRAKHAHAGKPRSTVRLAVALQCYIHDILTLRGILFTTLLTSSRGRLVDGL